jgi:predicted RNA-binding protein associated with RNAse of E/G family
MAMMKRTGISRELTPQLHLRYIRLPNQVLDIYDDLIYRSEKVIVGKSQITSTHSVMFKGEVVLAAGFQIVYFELMGKWFTVGKIRDLKGRHTGYYCDIVTTPRLLEDGGVELTDLFLDLWVSPDLRFKVLDEEELENAFSKSWITRQLYEKAKEELDKLVNIVEQGKFPPQIVKHLEKKLCL